MWNRVALLTCMALTPLAWSADPASRDLQRNQQMRQQQQDELQLRMQQYQRSIQTPPGDVRQQQTIRQLEVEQRQRQQQLQYRQNVETPPAPTTDDEGAQRAKAQIEQQRMEQERQQQLQRFDWEMEQRLKPPQPAGISGQHRVPQETKAPPRQDKGGAVP
jgi:hypothetical protein